MTGAQMERHTKNPLTPIVNSQRIGLDFPAWPGDEGYRDILVRTASVCVTRFVFVFCFFPDCIPVQFLIGRPVDHARTNTFFLFFCFIKSGWLLMTWTTLSTSNDCLTDSPFLSIVWFIWCVDGGWPVVLMVTCDWGQRERESVTGCHDRRV
jgi:hypothetical protein